MKLSTIFIWNTYCIWSILTICNTCMCVKNSKKEKRLWFFLPSWFPCHPKNISLDPALCWTNNSKCNQANYSFSICQFSVLHVWLTSKSCLVWLQELRNQFDVCKKGIQCKISQIKQSELKAVAAPCNTSCCKQLLSV